MKNKLKFSAMFMIFLVLSLPFAFAQKLDITRFSGEDGVEGTIRPAGDTLIIVASAELRGNPSEAVAKTRLKVVHAGDSEFFSSCASKGDSLYECRYESTDLINSGSEDYEIILLDAENNELKSVNKVLGVDEEPPEVIKFSVEPALSRTGDMRIMYLVEDYGRRVGDTSACAGIKEIEIAAGSTKVKKVDYPQQKVCDSGEQRIDYKYSAPDKFVGLDVCIIARDYLGQESDIECRSYSIDNSPPKIKSVEFRDSKGYRMSHIKPGQNVVADMIVVIENEDDVVLDSVKADLSKLNPGLKEKKADEEDGSVFIWRDITITSPGTCEVKVSASDEIGNNATATLACSLPVDDTGPIPSAIYASAADLNGTLLIGVNGTIFVDFKEEGSGMSKANAFLDLHNLGLGTVVQADKCLDQGAGVWRCEWKVVPKVTSGKHKISVLEGTSDDLGNYASHMDTEVIVDTTPPKVSSVDITFIHEHADYGPNTVYGDTVEFLFNVTDAVEGYANYSMIGGNYTPAIECTNTSCKFSALVDVSGPLNASISFDFFDIAKNKETYAYKFMIYGVLLNDTVTNYWTSKVTCSPRMIDRQSAEVYNHPVYCHMKLTPANPNARPVYVIPGDLSTCTGDFAGYVVDMEAINNNLGSKDPYLAFTLAAAPFAINELKFTCPVFISTSVGGFFSPAVEIENVTVNLQFYNLPYGELYTNTESSIRHSMHKAISWAEWVGTVEDVMDWVRKLCNTKTTITSVLSALELVIDWFGVIGAAVGLADEDVGHALVKQAKHLCNKGKSPLERLLMPEPEKSGDKVVPSQKKSVNLINLLDLACKAANCQLSRKEAEQYKDEWLVPASAVFGGGLSSSVCQGYQEFVGGAFVIDYNKLTAGEETGDVSSPTDVKESIVGSVACFCLPGISYNIEKIRQIYCGYAYCLGKRVLEEGVPRSYCSNEKAYLTCNYVVGQIFEVVPFASLVDRYASIIQEAYANPISLLAVASALVCGGNEGKGGFYDYCLDRGKTLGEDSADIAMYVICSIPKTAAKIGDAIASYQLTAEDWKKQDVSNDYCEMAEELME